MMHDSLPPGVHRGCPPEWRPQPGDWWQRALRLLGPLKSSATRGLELYGGLCRPESPQSGR